MGWLNFIIESLAFGATFIYGSTGEIITEKSGNLNLGIPGIMCMGGAGGCLVLNYIGKSNMNPILIVLLGILCSFAASAVMGVIYSFMTVTLRCNQNVTGLAMTTFGVGLAWTIMAKLQQTKYLNTPKKYYRFPFSQNVTKWQEMGLDSMQKLGVMFFLAIIIAVLASFLLYRTKVGLNLRAVGENPATADAVGINVTRYKYIATCIGSGIAGLGGFYYIIDFSGSGEAYKSLEAYGWLSIALVIFALWRPHLTIVGSTVFGILFSCSSYITNISWIRTTMATKPLLRMLPYIVTIIVLVVTSIRNKKENQPPASLGLSYFREDR
ncbi:MAG: ABC transporter permease [Clostridia bacterium]|nr:ABC transporter permease [Clostridia bacterium]